MPASPSAGPSPSSGAGLSRVSTVYAPASSGSAPALDRVSTGFLRVRRDVTMRHDTPASEWERARLAALEHRPGTLPPIRRPVFGALVSLCRLQSVEVSGAYVPVSVDFRPLLAPEGGPLVVFVAAARTHTHAKRRERTQKSPGRCKAGGAFSLGLRLSRSHRRGDPAPLRHLRRPRRSCGHARRPSPGAGIRPCCNP